jgi:WD40 repeat protein
VTISTDKSLKVYSGETYECVTEKGDLHTMGINDLSFGEEGQIFTCSSDRTVKEWKLSETLEEVKTYNLSEFDATGLKDNVEKQQLGLMLHG